MNRSVLRLDELSLVLVLLALSLCSGCGSSNHPAGKTTTNSSREDSLATFAERLQREPTADVSREVLQSIDSATAGKESRPSLSEAQRKTLGAFVPLQKSEWDEITAETFTANDAYHLAECMLLRDAAESLELLARQGDSRDAYPDATRARLAFEWICRQIYLDIRSLPVVPPWYSLEAGMGSSIDRSYAFLGMMHQIGIPACLIGPSALQNSAVARAEEAKDGIRWRLAPIQAVGALVGKDVLLFDPWTGEAVRHSDGKKLVTLAEIRSNPDLAKSWLQQRGIAPEEPRNWQAFLSCPIAGLAPRMSWLEDKLKDTTKVALYWDILGWKERFQQEAAINCSFWNPDGEAYTYTRLQISFHRPGSGGRPGVTLRDRYIESFIPMDFCPQLIIRDAANPQFTTRLGGLGQRWVERIFSEPIRDLHFRHGSSRDRILRGEFQAATTAIDDLKNRQDGIRVQAANTPNLANVMESWAEKAKDVFAEMTRAEDTGDQATMDAARSELSRLEKSPETGKAVLFIQKQASQFLAAEASFLMAQCVHEKAERFQARLEHGGKLNPAEVQAAWQNAASWWQTYLGNHPEVHKIYPAREAHVKQMLQRCEHMGNPTPKKP